MSELYNRQRSLGLNIDQSIMVVGAGGIGYWVIKFAAMSGIKEIRIFDDDVFQEHNFNRIDLNPEKYCGSNKARVAKDMVEYLRSDCIVWALPYKFNENLYAETDWIVDCTDIFASQEENFKIAQNKGVKYMKVGYDGFRVSINDKLGEWGVATDSYTVVPSWVVPATIIASLAVAKILKYEKGEVGCEIGNMFREPKTRKGA